MGWHTLKRNKASQKAAAQQQQPGKQENNNKSSSKSSSIKQKNSTKDKNFKNLSIPKPPSPVVSTLSPSDSVDDVFASDDKVETLLARAVYDNHADAPDELSIRKGDIVTVIEKDIDGLTGWWLCLLHGQQGIVPGNRLKVIPPVELDQFERRSASSKKRASYETDDNSDGVDAVDSAPHNYDYLPNPVKTPGFVPALSIKDMFDIPLRNKQQSTSGGGELYDVPSANTTLDTTQEIYDTPSSNRSSHNMSQSNTSIPAGYDSPRMGRKVIGEPTETYDVPSNLTAARATPPKQPEPYKVPKKISGNSAGPDELYDIPKSRNAIEVDELMGEILDSPFNAEPLTSTIKRTPLNSNSSTPRTSFTSVNTNVGGGDTGYPQELYDVPKQDSHSQELHGSHKPNSLTNNLLRKNMHLQSPPQNTSSHTLPRGFSPRTQSNSSSYTTPKSTPTRLQEIYNIPSTTIASNRSLPGTPVVSRKSMGTTPPSSQDIYDVPAPRLQDPTNNPEFMSMLHQLERQNSSNHSKRSSLDSYHTPTNGSHQELYDIPNKSATRPLSNHGNHQYQNTPATSHEYGNNSFHQEVYDVLPSKNNSLPTNSNELYDVPPPRNTQTLGRATKTNRFSGGQELYDVPPNQTSTPRAHEIYDTPPSSFRQQNNTRGQEIYDIPPNNSAHSTQEIYDIPPNNSAHSTQEIYDIPPNNSTSTTQEIYDVPPPLNNKNTPPQEEIYDVPSSHDLDRVMADAYSSHKTNRNHNNNYLLTPSFCEDDYVDYHDIWSKEPPKELIQQHAKNITVKEGSSRPLSGGSPTALVQKRHSSGGSSDKGSRSILDQINFEAVKELQLTVTEALDRLSKLHLAVDTCVQTLKCFHIDSWLEIPLLKTTIPAIRDFSGKLKTALRLLTEFGLGTLVNTTNNINGESLMDKIIGDVEPLLESYYKVKICLMHLDSHSWAVPTVRNPTTDKFFATLNAIMILSQRIPDQCRLFTLAVQNNAAELFTADSTTTGTIANGVREMSLNEKPTHKVPQQKVQLLAEPTMSAEALRKELAGRRQQARDATLRPVPRIPPKPNLPNQRRSLAGMMDSPEMNPRYSLANRGGYGHIERLVTDYQPDNSKQKKYASDPTTPSYTDAKTTLWGGSCPVLLDRNSAAAATPLGGVESASSSSSFGTGIPEETIHIKQTDMGKPMYPSDSNLISPSLTPMHTRSASLPWDDKMKNVFTFENDNGPKSPSLSPLDHRDIESLEFFCRQVESQVLLLRESMKNLTETVENRDEPVVFVSHSKFIILTAHKVVHSGQEITQRLLNTDIKSKIKDHTTHLTVCIRGVVAATKTAALEYPEPNSMMEMISSVLALGDAVRIIHSECRHALNA